MSDPGRQQFGSNKSIVLQEFKKRLADCQLPDESDAYLNKWLIARNYNLDAAEDMLRQSVEWRRINQVDTILQTYEPSEVFSKYYTMSEIGTDKFGCPVWHSAQGRLDMLGLIHSATKKEVTRYHIWLVESMARALHVADERNGTKHEARTTCLFDMDGLSLRKVTSKQAMDASNEAFKMFEANYPETLRRVFIINAPAIFTLAFKIIRPILHQATVDKIRIFGYNRDEWVPALLEEIDADQLPGYYGGTMTDPDGDPLCPSKVNMGAEVPKEYYLRNSAPKPRKGMETAHIIAGSGGKKKLKFKVDTIDTLLKWEFISEGGDVGFRVYCKKGDGSVIDLVPHSRVESHLLLEEGQISCDYTGKYVVEFDNSFSYIRPKKIHYFVTVDPSGSDTRQ